MTLKTGTQLGPYTINSPLGKGGMGEVYRATDTRLGRDVAIKVLPDNLSTDEKALKRFQGEAKALATLSHSNIVTIFDVGTDQGISYVVMELLEGKTLRTYVTTAGLPWEKAVEIAIKIAEGLAAAQSKGVVHRDLKPENIWLTSDENVKILDFGLARLRPNVTDQQFTDVVTESVETQPGIIRGTVPYMSPEQVRGESLDARTDIFSFGCIIYEMITGRRPFSGQTQTETMASILKDAPLKPSELSANVPEELEDLIFHCLKKNREQRFQSAQDLAFALKKLLTSQPTHKAIPASATKIPKFVIPVAIAAAIILIAFYSLRYQNPGKTIDSIAVLPFANTSANSETEYLTDGITESLINHLTKVPNLRVIARTTAFTYKGKQIEPREIANKLNVQAVLTGKLELRGNDLVIQTDLINGSDGSQIWGDRFINKKLKDILQIQEEIASEISDHLKIKLTGEQKMPVIKSYTQNIEAFQAYLKGRYYWNQRSEEGLKKALSFFQQAIDKDPTYAPAYSGIADVYITLFDYEILPAADANARAGAAIKKALEIDETLSEAHTSLAHLYLHEWKWEEAEREFKQAIDLKPGYSTAYHWYSLCLTTLGRADEAVEMMKLAQELDPLSTRINADLGMAYFAARKYDEAINQELKTLELNPKSSTAIWISGMAYEQKGDFKNAIHAYEEALKLAPGEPNYLAALGHTYGMSNRKSEAEKILNALHEESKKTAVSPFFIALVYTGMKENDLAFNWLEKAFQERSGSIRYLKVEPRLDGLRSDPRYTVLMKRAGLSS